MSRISDLAGFTTALSTTEDLSVGIITASSFSGNLAGNATGLSGTPDITVNNVTGAAVTFTAITGALTGNATGLSGTPNITVGAVNASSGTISGNLSIGGTLTYQDVTNVDAVGMVTAQQGIQVLANGLTITGVSTFNDNIDLQDDDKILIGTGDDLQIYHDGTHSRIVDNRDTGTLRLQADNFKVIDKDAGETMISAVVDGAVELYHNNSKKLETSSGGVTVTGTVAATSFSGSGENLTNLPASGDSNDITASLFI